MKIMKKLILFSSILIVLVGCGPSQKEKEEIAILTCNIMGESRNMDASLRIKEINAARIQLLKFLKDETYFLMCNNKT